VGLRCAFQQASPGLLPAVFTIKPPAEPPWPCSLRYTVAATPQARLVWSHKTTSPAECKHGVRKHLWMRGMQTSLATIPKPRASAYEKGLTNISTSQSTYANHQVSFKPYASGEHKCGVGTPLYLSLAPSHLKWLVGAHIYSPHCK
jgi:hypothetical protein